MKRQGTVVNANVFTEFVLCRGVLLKWERFMLMRMAYCAPIISAAPLFWWKEISKQKLSFEWKILIWTRHYSVCGLKNPTHFDRTLRYLSGVLTSSDDLCLVQILLRDVWLSCRPPSHRLAAMIGKSIPIVGTGWDHYPSLSRLQRKSKETPAIIS